MGPLQREGCPVAPGKDLGPDGPEDHLRRKHAGRGQASRGGEADAQATAREEEVAKFLDSVYAELSDGTHPTMWSLAGHSEIREDRTGVKWSRRADPSLRGGPLFDLDMCLKFIVGALERVVETADAVNEAFRKGPGADDKLRQAAAKVVETVLANPPELPDEARRVLEERGSALLEYWRSRGPE